MSYDGSPYNSRNRTSRYRDHSHSRNKETSLENGYRKRPHGESTSKSRPTSEHKKGYPCYDLNDNYPVPKYNGESRHRRHDRQRQHSSPRYTQGMEFERTSSKHSSKVPETRERSPPKPSRVLGAFGLAVRTQERHLYDVMSEFGHVENVKMVYDSLSGRSRGFAFIYYRTLEEARAARAACSRGLELHGKLVRIDYSYTKKPHDPTPGVYMGQEKWRYTRLAPSDLRVAPPAHTKRRSRSRSSQLISRVRRPPPGSFDPYMRTHIVTSSPSQSPSPPPYSPKRRNRAPAGSTNTSVYRPNKHNW